MRRSIAEFDVLGELIELCTLGKLDDELGVDGFAVFALHIFRGDGGEVGKPVLGEELGDLGDKGNAFAHAFDLDGGMLFEDELAQEQPLVEPRVAPDSEHVGFIEFGVLPVHLYSTI